MTTLCLHTSGFPYGVGEQFIEAEIKCLSKAFKRVVIIPSNMEGDQRSLPEGVEVMAPDYSGYNILKGILNIRLWMFDCIPDILKSKKGFSLLKVLLRLGYQSEVLYHFLKEHGLIDNTLHYTYWFSNQSTRLSILRSTKKINGFISRAHGFDLYEERSAEGQIPFRKFQLKHVLKLFLISKNGLEYMQKKYPQFSEKYELSYLGIENGVPLSYKDPESNRFTIVSCSRVVDIKRLHLIIKSLAGITDIRIRWIHFGDGPLFNDMKLLADNLLPANVNAEFRGHVANEAIFEFYKNHHVDCFINVSSTEGLPVTIMEAISFGIPVIATDVGGTSEIVTPQTGILLNATPAVEDITDGIIKTLNSSARNSEKRKIVYNFWNTHFNAKVNYSNFSKILQEFRYKVL